MDWNARKKILRRDAARYAMKTAYWMLNKLPYGMVKGIVKFLIAVGFMVTGRHRRVARESLAIAFGKEKSAQEIEAIIDKCFRNFGQAMVEMIYFNEHLDMVDKHMTFEGREHLEAALKKGKGVMAVTAHFGNFPLLMMQMARMGYPTHVLMRNTRDPKIDEFLLQKRNEAGLGTIFALPRKAAVMNTLKALRNNEIVFILMDQNFGSDGGVFVDFFGQQAATAPGPIVLAQRANAPIVPIFIRRENDDMYKVTIEPEMELEKRDDYDEMVTANVAKVTKIIEGYIRKYPHEWGWMHRRWKTQIPNRDASSEVKEVSDGARQDN